MRLTQIKTAFCIGFAAVSMMAQPALAAEYPHKTVKLVTHSSPGGGTDVFLRELIKHLSPIMGVTFVVENVRGGAGAKAMASVAGSPADGSVFYGTTPSYINTSILSKPDKTYEDMDPVVNMFQDPQIVFVRADSPYKTLKDVVEDAKKRPNQVRVGVSTPGSLDRQIMEQLKAETATEMTIITHDGGGDVMLSVLNGTSNVGIGEIAELRGQIDAKKIRLITTYTEQRLPQFADVPTAKEQGMNLVVRKFRGIAGPKGLPREVIAAWQDAAQKVLQEPKFKAVYEKDALIPAYMDHETYKKFLADFAQGQKTFFTKYNITTE
ncbi:tripartite tricarboxylate transporter substrate binding protein [Microvirga sp. BT689]|uniref:Bug family tripartite tricarboxylate transporter substrate binding protein n=1 Tax=Microvirga arvi TaxID=2778731 RepID=UPI00194E4120|nr:tripartite tricarboxylate transporter substrate binding protein [Microvirga arvi]MBM6583684.1 tripartite tricarboxylate transporter substrate binding protein [Microvirga arvi]